MAPSYEEIGLELGIGNVKLDLSKLFNNKHVAIMKFNFHIRTYIAIGMKAHTEMSVNNTLLANHVMCTSS